MVTPRAELLSGPFTLREALDAGLTKGRLRSKAFGSPFRGVYAPAAVPDDLHNRCRAAALVLPDAAVFSHSTAARLWQLPLPSTERELEVCVPAGVTVPQVRGIRSHERKGQDDGATATIAGLRLTTPAAVFVDMAERLNHMQLTALGDAILSARLATRPELERTVDRATRRAASAWLDALCPRSTGARNLRWRATCGRCSRRAVYPLRR